MLDQYMAPYIDQLVPFVARYGYPVLFLGALLEHTVILGAFLPGATFVALGGLLAQQGHLSFELVVLATALGSFLGDHVDYFIGRRLPRGTPWEQRLGPYVGYAERLIARWGGLALIGAKFINATRSVVAVSAGFCGMPYWRFAVFAAIAAPIWATTYTAGGWALGLMLEFWYLALLAGPVAMLFAWRWRVRLRTFLLGDPVAAR